MEILDDCYGVITYDRISVLEETNLFIKRENNADTEKLQKPESATSKPEPTKPTGN